MGRNLRSEDGGFSLVWLAIILVLLLGMAGFATDLGWIYLNTVRTQNAVDAAALAGVVNLPGFDPAPDAEAAARANGYDPGGADTLSLTPNADNQLHAELSTSVEPFFMKVFGFTHFDITRDATAEYVKPVPLGSPSNCFGGGATSACPSSEDFWAAVSGRHTRLEDGDPYSTQCDLNSGGGGGGVSCTTGNPNYQRAGAYGGYYYGVEVDGSMTDLRVLLFDAGYDERGIGNQTGDSNFSPGGGPDVYTTFELYPPDTTPLIPNDHLTGGPICSVSYNPGAMSSIWNWTQLCGTIANPVDGIYLVHVESTNPSAGSNNFAIRATATGGTPKVYGINDMSIWSNDFVGASELYLAEIVEEHAGKKLELAFYDAGDANGQSWYYVKTPFGNTATCSYTVWTADWPLPSATQVGSGGPGPCQWETQTATGSGSGVYNKEWIVATIDLPDDPADMCDETKTYPCYWKMLLDLHEPTERTTWQARVIGNPVRLLP
jgi:hypothetical protein